MAKHDFGVIHNDEDERQHRVFVEKALRDALEEPFVELDELNELQDMYFNGALAAAGLMTEDDFYYEE